MENNRNTQIKNLLKDFVALNYAYVTTDTDTVRWFYIKKESCPVKEKDYPIIYVQTSDDGKEFDVKKEGNFTSITNLSHDEAIKTVEQLSNSVTSDDYVDFLSHIHSVIRLHKQVEVGHKTREFFFIDKKVFNYDVMDLEGVEKMTSSDLVVLSVPVKLFKILTRNEIKSHYTKN